MSPARLRVQQRELEHDLPSTVVRPITASPEANSARWIAMLSRPGAVRGTRPSRSAAARAARARGALDRASPACWVSSSTVSIISPSRRRPVALSADQDLERVEAARRVERAADEVELALGLVLGPVEVDARVVDGRSARDVGDEQRARAERHPPQLVQVGGDRVRALDAVEPGPVAVESVRPEPTAASTWNQALSCGRAVGERVERVDRAEVGRARGADDGDHMLAASMLVEGVESRARPGVGGDADHRLGAEPEQRGGAPDAVVRGGAGHDPPVVLREPSRRTSSPARSRASSSPSRFDAVPPIVITPDRCAARASARAADERVLDERGRGRGVERVHRLVGHADRRARPPRPGSAAPGAGGRRRRVPEPDAAVEDRGEVFQDLSQRGAVVRARVERAAAAVSSVG